MIDKHFAGSLMIVAVTAFVIGIVTNKGKNKEMEHKELTKTNNQGQIMERVIAAGDLAKLSSEDRIRYYMTVCESIGLNPLTKPFELITLNNKMVLYATRTCTDQLREIKKVSISILDRAKDGDLYIVTARATTADGRTDESTGVVSIQGLRGEMLANAYLKAETKAKRRVTLSISGLGWIDESEADSIPGAKKQTIDIQQPLTPSPTKEIPKPVVREDSVIIEPIKPPTPAVQAAVDAMEKVIEKTEASTEKKFEHLSDEQVQAMKNAMITAKLSKQELMSYSHSNFHKPLIAITQEEYKILMMDLENSK